mmetsp:Transcript_4172/g.13514  ORF Transcript_4172/g.13514 Transcript_4172/m.13514 type:complete len:288 (+) Transcript_4172:124-987(+)
MTSSDAGVSVVVRGRPWQERAEAEVLHDRQLAEHLALVHAQQPLDHLVPRVDGGDVVQVGRVLPKGPLLDLADEGDGGEVEVVRPRLGEQLLVVDRRRLDPRVPDQLRRAKDKHEVLVVVEPPHAVRAGRLEAVRGLEPPHQRQVPLKDTQHHGGPVCRIEHLHQLEAAEPGEELQLVPRPVVDPGRRPKRLGEVGGELRGRVGRRCWRAALRRRALLQQLRHQGRRALRHPRVPRLEGFVPIAHRLLDWRGLVDPRCHRVELGQERADHRPLLACVRHRAADNGLG